MLSRDMGCSGLDANRHPAASPIVDAVGRLWIVAPDRLNRRPRDPCPHEQFSDLLDARFCDARALGENPPIREFRGPAASRDLQSGARNLLRIVEDLSEQTG